MQVLETTRIRHYEFYNIKDEYWDSPVPDDEPHLMKKQAYTKEGDWIGSSVQAYRLVHRFGIQQFEKTEDDHCVCSIGYCPDKHKWYGWSHRAIFGFKIGSTCKKGDCAYVPETFGEIKADCHARQGDICTIKASYPVSPIDPSLPEGTLEPSGPAEDAGPCNEKECVFETGRGEWAAQTLEDAKQMAIDFAKSVS